MKLTYNWLKRYVDFDWSPEELAGRLTMLGLEVESLQKTGAEWQGVVVAQVLSLEKHPNADKLSLCRVNDGHGERQIVCGAHNFKVGDKVPLILPGSTLPAKPGAQPVTIKAGKIRGCQSDGMMCSPEELGLTEQVEGLLILREDALVGQSFAGYMGRPEADAVYDLEVTPNRPDWNSVMGIAREVAALTGNPLRLPEITIDATRTTGGPVAALAAVRIEDGVLCPRYTARLLRGLAVGPSPDWMRALLEKVGLRSISNVVDVTNYVMLETGQPSHAFDYRKIAAKAGSPPTIVVRRARQGEEFVTLDGQKHTLNEDMLLIADETKALALAGIMGGQNSEIAPDTTDVLIESACFKPQSIRATSKKLELRTDSSYRFERGADVGICDWASRRAAQLMLETAGGSLMEEYIDQYPGQSAPREIRLRFAKTGELLGVHIPAEIQTTFLKRLELQPLETTDTAAVLRVPTFRVDLKREADLIEEVARLYGVDKIPSTQPRGAMGRNDFDEVHDAIGEARRILAGLGWNEAQAQTLISEAAAGLATQKAGSAPAALLNPMSSDMNLLRPSLLPGLVEALRHNASHKNPGAALFEIGKVFFRQEGAFQEERRLALALTGPRGPVFWDGANPAADIFDLKGALEEFLEQFGLRGVTWVRRGGNGPLFLESAAIQLGKLTLGELGQLSPLLARQYDLRQPAFLAELDFDLLLSRRVPAKSFKPLPQFPTIRRDVAMLVGDAITHEAVLGVVRQARPANLETVELFDVFRGGNVPSGQKSMAYCFIYRNAGRTLTDVEVNTAHEALVDQFKKSLQAAVRDAG